MFVANDPAQRSELERELLRLLEASSLLLASPESQDVLETLLSLGQSFIQADAHAVWWKQSEGEAWEMVAMSGLSRTYCPTVVDPGGSARLLAAPVAIEDIHSAPAFSSRSEHYQAEGICSLLIVPLRIQERTGRVLPVVRGQIDARLCGTAVFYYRTRHRFSETEMRIGAALGNLAASALTTTELYAEQKRLLEEAEHSSRRAKLLAEAGEVISASLDYEHTLKSIAERAVPFFADWCAVDVMEKGEIRRVAMKHLRPEQLRLAAHIAERYPPAEDSAILVALRTGESLFMEEIPDQLLSERARNEEHAALIRKLGLRSVIVAPLTARGSILGCLTFATAESGRRYSREDLEATEELARRAAIALDNARLFEQARRTERRRFT